MPARIPRRELTPGERSELERLAHARTAPARLVERARIILVAAEGRSTDDDGFRFRGVPLGSGAIESTIRRVHDLRLKGTSLFWDGANAEAVIQLSAAVLSGRWEERLERTREVMAQDRRTDWDWDPPGCLAELKAMDEGDDGPAQLSSKKHSQRLAA